MRTSAAVLGIVVTMPLFPRLASALEPPVLASESNGASSEPPPAETDATAARNASSVELRLTEPGAVLQRYDWRRDAYSIWTFSGVVCNAPCDARVSRDAKYRVLGADFPPSGRFSPPSTGESFQLDVHKGNRSVGDAGGILTILGGVSGGAAVATLAFGKADVGTVILSCIGIVGLAVGIPALLTSATTVHFD